MKKILIILILLAFCSHTALADGPGKKKKCDLKEESLKGAVKTVTEVEYEAKGTAASPQKGKLISKTVTRYNKDGNITERIRTKADGSSDGKYVCGYDEAGNCITTAMYNADGTLNNASKSTFDKLGNEECTGYDSSGQLDTKFTLKYNGAGQLIEYNVYDMDDADSEDEDAGNAITISHIYTYDNEGNNTEEDWYDPEKSLICKFTRKFDPQHHQVEELSYEDNELTAKNNCAYDGKGNKTWEKTYKGDGSPDYTYAYQYDATGNMTGWTMTTYDGKKTSVSATGFGDYDPTGNWRQSTLSDNGAASELITRDIEYY